MWILAPKRHVSRFFRELQSNRSKLSQGVQGLLLHALGILADSHPDYVRGQAEVLVNYYMRALEKQTEADEEKTVLVAGIFDGLNRFLNEFAHMLPLGALE